MFMYTEIKLVYFSKNLWCKWKEGLLEIYSRCNTNLH